MATLCGRSFVSCLGFSFLLLFGNSFGRRHHIKLEKEQRKTIGLSKFGFLKNGVLTIKVDHLVVPDKGEKYGFSLEKTASDGISPYMEQHKEKCIFEEQSKDSSHVSVVMFIFNFRKKWIEIIKKGDDFNKLQIINVTTNDFTKAVPTAVINRSTAKQQALNQTGVAVNNTAARQSHSRRRRDVSNKDDYLPLLENTRNETFFYSTFQINIKNKVEEGLYNLYFHNCHNFDTNKKPVLVTMEVDITEQNGDDFLSAGEEPLPYLFGVMGTIFFVTAFFWLYILRKNKEYTFKVHYMMFVLVLLKAFDNMFQAVDFHFINKEGTPMKAWAVLYYIAHLLKGALLFTTIVLIGTGFFFIKHVLSKKEKKIFLIVIPLQILANTAQIVMESTEAADKKYATWNEIFILVDLLCCGAILFPVVWSIRHLQEASHTDGKAALNLTKLKLFRHFYVMIVCYIYFTRIIVYLVKITVPFQYMWLNEFFKNVATFVFFVMTGYKFSPVPDNPYLHVPQDDTDEEEVEMDEVVTSSGAATRVTKKQRSGGGETV